MRLPGLRKTGGFCAMPTPGGVPVEMTTMLDRIAF
jgi:hypothetical protein